MSAPNNLRPAVARLISLANRAQKAACSGDLSQLYLPPNPINVAEESDGSLDVRITSPSSANLPDPQRETVLPFTMFYVLCTLFPGACWGESNERLSILTNDRHGKRLDLYVGRAICFLRMLLEEGNGGCRARAKGWVIRFLDNDPRNLRSENVTTRAAWGYRNSHKTAWTIEHLLKAVAGDKAPDTTGKGTNHE